nr:leucine-rich repeat and IQ domain-containing protein 3-like [Meriones unguiculatus]
MHLEVLESLSHCNAGNLLGGNLVWMATVLQLLLQALCQQPSERALGTSYEDEMKDIKLVISRINEILAHNSPVLIVQRWIRGYLVRKHLSLHLINKRPPKSMIRVLAAKWIYIGGRREDKILEDVFHFKPESNIKAKVAQWKQMVSTPDNFKHSTEYRNIPWFAYELKMKDTDGKPKTRRHHIQKGPKETKDESDEEEVDTRFRISAMKIPLYSPRTFTYGAMLKEMKRDYIPDYVQPLPAPRPKPPIKTETLKELRKRKEFLTSERAGMNLHMFNDIDKYHVEQKHQEREERKLKAVITAQVSQERARLSIKEHGRRKIHMAQKQVEKDHETIQKGLRKIWKEKLAYLGKVRERKSMFLAEKKLKATEHSLVQSMNNERSVLLRGINNVDRLKRNLSDSRNKHRIVAEKWKAEKYKNSLLRQGKELRAEETRRKHREEKFVIDTLILHKACERFEEAKAKVALIKSLERHRE